MSDQITVRPADAVPDGWVDRRLPEGLRPWARLMRLDRPVGVWLLLWPCWWSVMLAGAATDRAPWDPFICKVLLAFAAGAIVMRGAGCIVNDLWDRQIDARVERTAGRPIASGVISPLAAIGFLFVLGLLGLAILLWFNQWTIMIALASVPLILLYPLAKRVTYWPQIVLGIVFNWGALLGWTALFDAPPAIPAILLYLGCFFWTLGYDTIYAHQDRADDVEAGVKSSALALKGRTKPFLRLCFCLMVALVGLSGWLLSLGPAFFAGMIGVALHFAWQLSKLDIDDPAVCLRLFKSNVDVGWLVFVALIGGYFLRG
ncbi:MAG: 4-hydroxybenzoate octaprenyltransferase [Alphaproteobacteria bacterium]